MLEPWCTARFFGTSCYPPLEHGDTALCTYMIESCCQASYHTSEIIVRGRHIPALAYSLDNCVFYLSYLFEGLVRFRCNEWISSCRADQTVHDSSLENTVIVKSHLTSDYNSEV